MHTARLSIEAALVVQRGGRGRAGDAEAEDAIALEHLWQGDTTALNWQVIPRPCN